MSPTLPPAAFATLRALLGAFELASPRPAARLVGAPTVSGSAPAVIRVLGARQVGQALVTLLRPTPTLLIAGAAVDGIHAASMLALGARRPWRRAALVEAAFGACLAGGGAWGAWLATHRPRPSTIDARVGAATA